MCKADKSRKPLIHCITNPIAMNQSANAVLALGARPIMAEHPLEVEEITETADALLLNLGNISDVRMESMRKSIRVANRRGIPVVLDLVGIACSKLRKDFAIELLDSARVDVLKGNYSEIVSLFDDSYTTDGVDLGVVPDENTIIEGMQAVAKRYDTIALATGKEDIIVDKDAVLKVDGGCEQLSEITGTGCMLGAVIATALSFNGLYTNKTGMVARACDYFKECGAEAEIPHHPGSFLTNLLDAICYLRESL